MTGRESCDVTITMTVCIKRQKSSSSLTFSISSVMLSHLKLFHIFHSSNISLFCPLLVIRGQWRIVDGPVHSKTERSRLRKSKNKNKKDNIQQGACRITNNINMYGVTVTLNLFNLI